MLTKNGICYNLIETPYKYECCGVLYHFSSQFYKEKFIEEKDNNSKQINESLSNRFDIKINVNLLANIVLYSKIEKRGFLIKHNEVFISCKNNLKFGGLNLKEKS